MDDLKWRRCTFLQPLIYAHVNGFTVHAALLPEPSSRSSYVRAAQSLVDLAVGASAPVTALSLSGNTLVGLD